MDGCRNSEANAELSFYIGNSRHGVDVRFTGAPPMGVIAAFAVALSTVPASAKPARRHGHAPEHVTGPATVDLSAHKRLGKASYYASQFFGRTMADGTPMNPRANNAASRTLPLETVAKVTDVATGKSAIVKIKDRGPYIKGRIVDLSPSTARKIGITRRIGVANVVVAPIAVPLPDGRVKRGPAADHASFLSIASRPHRRPNTSASLRRTAPQDRGSPTDDNTARRHDSTGAPQ